MSGHDVTIEDTQRLVDDLESRYPVGVWLHPLTGTPGVRLSTIRVEPARQGEGIGSRIMEEVTSWADEKDATLVLTPESDGRGFPSKAKLKSWYRSFGFVPNKGRRKDYLYRDTMIRRPSPKENPQAVDLATIKRRLMR